MRLRAEVYSRRQLESVLSDERIETVYSPIELLDSSFADKAEKIIVIPPAFLADCEAEASKQLEKLKKYGFTKALAHTAGHIELLRQNGFNIYGGVRLNCANSESLRFLAENGLRDAVVSTELTLEQINRLNKPFDIGFIAYGYLPLMITRRCPIKDGKPCDKERCCRTVTDRKGRKMDVICSRNTIEILNSELIDLGDRLDRFRNADFAVLKFTVENEISPVISAYCEGVMTGVSPFTRGLYFRGLRNEEKQNEHKG